jgi:preprotein translocase subunit Sec61beta
MSRRKRQENNQMPASSAGLMRFFSDESYGIKIRPEFVVVGAFTLIISVILARAFY